MWNAVKVFIMESNKNAKTDALKNIVSITGKTKILARMPYFRVIRTHIAMSQEVRNKRDNLMGNEKDFHCCNEIER
ncbi:hypothetical protein T12_12330 [Trichinella patagoniensis]|uniref:Uncharacterized protein n=1 Tax=Trichinella patagoniensis TaxID=990121 RepID=A0A0V1AGM7_9BILA|nr:hypothetical protein T12_12330 [Trichinella patagoniensis]